MRVWATDSWWANATFFIWNRIVGLVDVLLLFHQAIQVCYVVWAQVGLFDQILLLNVLTTLTIGGHVLQLDVERIKILDQAYIIVLGTSRIRHIWHQLWLLWSIEASRISLLSIDTSHSLSMRLRSISLSSTLNGFLAVIGVVVDTVVQRLQSDSCAGDLLLLSLCLGPGHWDLLLYWHVLRRWCEMAHWLMLTGNRSSTCWINAAQWLMSMMLLVMRLQLGNSW